MGVWKPLSGQIAHSFGQGKCTFDCQSGNFKNYGSGNLVSTSSCMLRIEKLITLNMTCIKQLQLHIASSYPLSHPFPFYFNYTCRRVKWGEHGTYATLATLP